jgi:PKD repeat protein
MTAIKGLSWRNGARKAIIVMGDAPGKDPEPITGYTRSTVLAAANALDPAVIFPVPIGTDPVGFFQPLADGSGGQVFEASDPSQVSGELMAAVETASIPLTAALTVGSPARPGTPVQFSAAGSWYDAGSITSYSWDFDGDGTPDATTSTDRATHTYAAPFAGTASVTVTTDDGHTATATAPVDIRSDAPVAAGPPSSLKAVAGSDRTSIALSWGPPADLGGGSVAAYEATLTDSTTGSLAAAQIVDPGTTSLTFRGLAAGKYLAEVWAGTEAGAGARASTSVSLGTYDVRGFFPPVANPPTVNARQAGAAIPLKFSLSGNQGLNILAAGSPSSVQVSCQSRASIGAPIVASSPGDSGLTYDASSDTYTFVWKTDRSWAGTCRRLDLTLDDGTTHSAQMRF